MGRTIQSKLSLCFFLSFIQEANQINNQADNAVISVNVTLAIGISVMVIKKLKGLLKGTFRSTGYLFTKKHYTMPSISKTLLNDALGVSESPIDGVIQIILHTRQ